MAELTRKEFSAGGVVYRKSADKTDVLLIARNDSKVWCLPKGKIEQGETHEAAALREIKEETGITGRIVKLLADIEYNFVSPVDGARVFKKVRFFLFEYESGSIVAQKEEVNDAAWLEIGKALKIMVYPSEIKIMQMAKREILQ